MARFWKILALTLTPLIMSCGSMGPTTFVHPDYNFGFVERVAVVPFENLSAGQSTGAQATRYFVAELLSAEVFEVVEPGEVSRAINKLKIFDLTNMTQEEVMALGAELGAQGIFLGTVNEATGSSGGSSRVITVSLVVRLLETESGITVWSATHTKDNKGFWSSLFGTRANSQSEVMRDCVHGAVSTLIH